jgi:hypothetical protein
LNILGFPLEEVLLFRRIYNKILFYDIAYSRGLFIRSEKRFRNILSSIHINQEDLHWGRIATGDNYESVKTIYERDSTPNYESLVEQYWKDNEGQHTVLEDIEFICYPLQRKEYFEFECRKIEHWEINKYSDHKKCLQIFPFSSYAPSERL